MGSIFRFHLRCSGCVIWFICSKINHQRAYMWVGTEIEPSFCLWHPKSAPRDDLGLGREEWDHGSQGQFQQWQARTEIWRPWHGGFEHPQERVVSVGMFCWAEKTLWKWCQWLQKKTQKTVRRVEPNVLNQDPDVSNCINWHYEHIRCDFEFRLGWTIFTRLHEVARKACDSADGLIDQLPVTFVIAAPAAIDWKSP